MTSSGLAPMLGAVPIAFAMVSSSSYADGTRVMVNAEDLGVRLNRLRLLSEVRELFVRGWDLSRVVVEGEKG